MCIEYSNGNERKLGDYFMNAFLEHPVLPSHNSTVLTSCEEEKNTVKSPVGLGTKNHYAGETQKQFRN
jgi:hypothetical protein